MAEPSRDISPLPEAASPAQAAPPAPRRPRKRWRRLLRWLGLLLLVLVLLLGGSLGWLCSGSGQRWLRHTLNEVLADSLTPLGLSLEVTALDGLPFAPRVGLTGRDSRGLWLEVPDLELRWGLSLSRPALRVDALRLHGGGLYRLPLLPEPEAAPPEVARSAGAVADAVCAGMARVLDVLASLPLPPVELRGLELREVALPAMWLCVEPPSAEGVPQVDVHQMPRLTLEGTLLAALGAEAQVDMAVQLAVSWPREAVRRALLRESRPPLAAETAAAGVDAPTLLAALLPVSCLGQGEVTLRLQARHTTGSWQLRLERLQVQAGMTNAALSLALDLPDRVEQWNAARIRLELDAGVRPLPAPDVVAALEEPARPEQPASPAERPAGAAAPVDAGTAEGDDAAAAEGASEQGQRLPDRLSLSWGNLFAGPTRAWLLVDGPLYAPRLSLRADSPGLRFAEAAMPAPEAAGAAPVAATGTSTGAGGADAKAGSTAPRSDLSRIAVALESYPLRWRQGLEGLPAHAAVQASVECRGTPLEARFRLLAGVGSPQGRLGEGEQQPFAGFLAVDDVQLRAAGARLDGQWLLAFRRGAEDAAGVEETAAAEAPVPDMAGPAERRPAPGEDPLLRHLRAVLESLPYMRGALFGEIRDWQALSRPLSLVLPDVRAEGAVTRLEVRASRPAPAEAPHWHVRLDAPRGSLRWAGGTALSWTGLSVDADLETAGALRLEADARVAGLDVPGQHFARGRVQGTGALCGPLSVSATVAGDMRLDSRLRWEPGRLRLERLQFSLPGQGIGLRLAGEARLEYGADGWSCHNVDLHIAPAGRLRLEGSLGPDKVRARLALEKTSLQAWQKVLPALPAGSVGLDARLDGQPARPQGQFSLTVDGLSVPGAALPPLDLRCQGSLRPGGDYSRLQVSLDVPEASRRALGADQVEARLRLPLAFSASGVPSLPPQAALEGRLRWLGRVGPLWQLVPMADRRLHGQVDVRLDASGTVQAPVVAGAVRLQQGRFEDVALGVLLQDINLAVELDKTALHSGLDALGNVRVRGSFTDGHKGRAQLNGELRDRGRQVRLEGQLADLRPLRRRDLMVDLSGTFGMSGALLGPDIRADIVINTGELRIDRLSTGSSIPTLPIDTGTAQAANMHRKVPRGSLDVRVRTPGRFVVRGRGLQSRWQADVRITGPLNDPQVLGSVEAVEGQFSLLGAQFLLHRGVVRFAGGAPSNPLLDVVLRHETPDLTADVRLGGSVQHLKLSLSSTPSLPQEEIISRIMFGRSSNELGRFENLRLAAAVAELAGFGGDSLSVLDVARKALGVDVLRVGSSHRGFSDDQGDDESSLQAGKYIGERLYLGVEQGLKSDSTAVVIELQLTPRSKAEVRTEQNNTSAGVRWKYNY